MPIYTCPEDLLASHQLEELMQWHEQMQDEASRILASTAFGRSALGRSQIESVIRWHEEGLFRSKQALPDAHLQTFLWEADPIGAAIARFNLHLDALGIRDLYHQAIIEAPARSGRPRKERPYALVCDRWAEFIDGKYEPKGFGKSLNPTIGAFVDWWCEAHPSEAVSELKLRQIRATWNPETQPFPPPRDR